ncbi:2Fe-2S iron-sulfur cluster-binding protein [Sphingobium xenophagum]|uniref:2Fe-2S iron-sulfur cluster-binding protein n=1 Tax=Sphingobium xenophagum TaxID=121428 RepID=UPI00037BFDAB|nr:2Fe-2S iron-sulfur cluster-binding protein [Sphingobium xenophagum]
MPNIHVLARDGSERTISVAEGISLMEALREGGFDDILALCGGCCSCATCHVYIEHGPEELKAPGSDDEDDLLESSAHRGEGSRLSCQITLDGAHDALTVRLAPED